jgi:hypothetical protein
MADQTIKATEEMVGSGHATKSDTLNRLTLVEHNTDGTHRYGVVRVAGRLENLSLAATVGSKALTVALKGEDGNDPSASNPVTIAFRDETLTTGTPNVRTVTGALSVVLASGGALGFTAAEAGRLYVWALDNAGTVMLGLSRTADMFPESNLVADPVDIGSGSDLANTMYVTAHVHNLACRCLGYIEITTGATAGEWDNAPTKIQVMGPGVKRTGDVVQVQDAIYTDVQDFTQDTWTAVTSLAISITPKSACNKVLLRTMNTLGSGSAGLVANRFCVGGSVISGSVGIASGSRLQSSGSAAINGSGQSSCIFAEYLHSPASISAQNYTVEVHSSDGAGKVNRSSGDSDSSGYPRGVSVFTVTEIEA